MVILTHLTIRQRDRVVYLTIRQRGRVVYERIVNEAEARVVTRTIIFISSWDTSGLRKSVVLCE